MDNDDEHDDEDTIAFKNKRIRERPYQGRKRRQNDWRWTILTLFLCIISFFAGNRYRISRMTATPDSVKVKNDFKPLNGEVPAQVADAVLGELNPLVEKSYETVASNITDALIQLKLIQLGQKEITSNLEELQNVKSHVEISEETIAARIMDAVRQLQIVQLGQKEMTPNSKDLKNVMHEQAEEIETTMTNDSGIPTPGSKLELFPMLVPNKGFQNCIFHGQNPWFDDRHVFEGYGGQIKHEQCKNIEKNFPSPCGHKAGHAQSCPCKPPGEEFFGPNNVIVEIGANDGTFLSNSFFFQAQMGWKAILVEGSPSLFSRIKECRPSAIQYNNFVSKSNLEGTFYTIYDDSDTWINALSGLQGSEEYFANENAARAYARKKGGKLKVDKIKAKSFKEIFAEQGVSHVRWLTVDVEGAELDVIDSVDYEEVQFDVICYENNKLEKEVEDKIEDILTRHGYERSNHKFDPEPIDGWFVRKDSIHHF